MMNSVLTPLREVLDQIRIRPSVHRRLQYWAMAPECRRWCHSHPCETVEGRHELYRYLLGREDLGGPIDYIEFGVSRGDSIRWWVENNRDSVDKATNGQIAYVHIRAMDQPSLERFQNEIDRFWQKKGIIVDIRNNGGGNIDQELLDILERQPYQFWNNRNGSRTWGRRPRQAIVGPKVMMINYRSVSDAEVTPAGFRQLGLGKLVGNPTSAQVIATGSYSLINGGTIRTPGSLVVTWDPTRPNNYGLDLENLGIPPDVWVKNSPADEAKGLDKELKVAIDEAMKMLKEGNKLTSMDKDEHR